MKTVEYPERTCREGVFGTADQAYPCDVVWLHAGPCASFSVPATVRQRDAWEEAHPGWEKLGLFDDPFREIKP